MLLAGVAGVEGVVPAAGSLTVPCIFKVSFGFLAFEVTVTVFVKGPTRLIS